VPQQLGKAPFVQDVGWIKIIVPGELDDCRDDLPVPCLSFFSLDLNRLDTSHSEKLKRHSLFSKILVPFCGM
jgi:hypothetical protein